MVPANPSPATPDAAAESGEKRIRILDAAQSLFLRYGVRRTSIDDVAREAGIAKGTVYLYFDSKTALFAAIAERLCAATLARAKAIVAEARPPAERLVAFLDCYVGETQRMIAQSPHVAELTASKEAIAAAAYEAHDGRMASLLTGLLEEAGVAHDAATEMFTAAAMGTLRTGDIAEEPYRARLAMITNILLAGLVGEATR